MVEKCINCGKEMNIPKGHTDLCYDCENNKKSLESYTRCDDEDSLKLIGAKVIGIAKSDVDKRKVIVIERMDSSVGHIESPRGTTLIFADMFKYK